MSSEQPSGPLEQYRQNLLSGARSSASEYARKVKEQKYLEQKMKLKFISNATQATAGLERVVERTREMNETLEKFQVFAAQAATEIYGLQSWLSHLSVITGEDYISHMDDPQTHTPLSTEGLIACLMSVTASVRYVREHTASTRLIMDTNRQASKHVNRLFSALEPSEELKSVLDTATKNRYAESASRALAQYEAAELD